MDMDVFNEEGKPVRGEVGYLVMKKPCPSITKGFWNDPQRYLETYWSRWPDVWLHGDWALVDRDGFWFILGRADDTIKLAGRRVGPGEVEAALISSGLVAEAAAIGIPDPVRGEALLCFVVPKAKVNADDSLKQQLMESVSAYLGKAFAPKEIIVVTELPRTRSGKIVRRLIRKKFLGEENLGDLSTIENPAALDQIKPETG
jgi:acetyl-CoA synthetase